MSKSATRRGPACARRESGHPGSASGCLSHDATCSMSGRGALRSRSSSKQTAAPSLVSERSSLTFHSTGGVDQPVRPTCCKHPKEGRAQTLRLAQALTTTTTPPPPSQNVCRSPGPPRCRLGRTRHLRNDNLMPDKASCSRRPHRIYTKSDSRLQDNRGRRAGRSGPRSSPGTGARGRNGTDLTARPGCPMWLSCPRRHKTPQMIPQPKRPAERPWRVRARSAWCGDEAGGASRMTTQLPTGATASLPTPTHQMRLNGPACPG